MNEEEKKAIEYSKNCLMKITLGIECEFDVNILDILLNIIKKLQKENEELNYKSHSKKIALEIYNRYIPKSKVKEEIDRIDYDIKKTKEIILNNSNIHTSDRRNDYQIVRLRAMNTKSLDIKKRLQELLESEE
jgi:uncharacterized protein YicC (UPF0701 family)